METQKSNENLLQKIDEEVFKWQSPEASRHIPDAINTCGNIIAHMIDIVKNLEQRVQELERKTEIGYVVHKPVENGK